MIPEDTRLDLTIVKVGDEDELALVHHIREVVFIEEQNVPRDREYDEYEEGSIHFLAYADGDPAGCIRYRRSGDRIKLERLAVLKEFRGRGIGKALMDYVEKRSSDDTTTEFVLNSQLHAMEFYEKCGYKARGGIFLDADIEHREMFKKANAN